LRRSLPRRAASHDALTHLDSTAAATGALVLGATGSIGSAVAEHFAAARADLVIVSRDGERLDALKRRLCMLGASTVECVQCDFNDDLATQQLDITNMPYLRNFVHCAGASPRGSALEISDEVWHKAYNTKILGFIRFIRQMRPLLVAEASVVAIAGQDAFSPSQGYALGCLNAALCHLVKTLAQQLAPDRIRVNAINPGPVISARLDRRVSAIAAATATSLDAASEQLLQSLPLGTFVRPDDIVDAVAYLATAQNVTGSTLSISAGRSSHVLQ